MFKLSVSLVLSLVAAFGLASQACPSAAQGVATLGGSYEGTASFTDRQCDPPCVDDPRPTTLEITQFGNVGTIEFTSGISLSGLHAEIAISSIGFSGEDVRTHDERIAWARIDATFSDRRLTGAMESPGFNIDEFDVTCVSGPCLSDSGMGGAGGDGGPRVFWSAADGDFLDETNWEPARVPGSDDTAVFDVDAFYTVRVDETVSTNRAVIERGFVTLSGGSYSLQGTLLNPEVRSLAVGTFLSEPASLTLSSHALNSTHSVIGRDSAASGEVTVDGSEGFVVWQESGRVSVGLDGDGTLNLIGGGGASALEARIGDGADGNGVVNIQGTDSTEESGQTLWSTGSIAVGHSGAGAMTLRAGRVLSQTASIGENAGSMGSVVLERLESLDGSLGTAATWETDNLTIGNAGTGSLVIDDSALTTDGTAVLGGQVTGEGTVTLTGVDRQSTWTLSDSLFVGHRGRGTLDIDEVNRLEVPGDLWLGLEEGAVGEVNVRPQSQEPFFGSELIVGRLLVVGSDGEGRLTVNGRLVTSGGALIPFGSGRGHVLIDAAPTTWDATSITLGTLREGEVIGSGTLSLGRGAVVLLNGHVMRVLPGSLVQGHGVIADASAIEFVEGSIAPGVVLQTRIATKGGGGPEEIQGVEEGRTLEVGNVLDMTGGRIEVRVDGTAEGDFDQLIVTGDAALEDTVIATTFGQGFSPKIGDEFPVVVVEGSLITQNVTFEISGADPGFEFAFAEVDGALVVMTTREPQSGGSGCSTAPTVAAGGETGFGFVLLALSAILWCVRIRRNSLSPWGSF